MTIDQLHLLADIKNAANSMTLIDFCAALNNDVDEYAEDKYKDFRELGRLLPKFTSGTLTKLIEYQR